VERLDQSSAVCEILTYKEGLFSSFAHDLRIKVTSFNIELGGTDNFIKAEFDVRSLLVECAVVDGRDRPDLLSQRDRDEINKMIITEVLDIEKHPVIYLVSSSVRRDGLQYLVRGGLTVNGEKREISFTVRKEDGQHYVTDVSLHLPDFGIKPFSALFGTVRLKPDILIHISIPAERIEAEALS
jgi:YceI-like domain